MEQTFYDSKNEAIFRNRIDNFLIDKLTRTFSSSMTEPHYHPYYEFFYLTKGKCRIFVGHSLYFLEEGDLVILCPSSLHRTIYEKSLEVERITVSFTEDFIKAYDFPDFLKTDILKTQKISFKIEEKRKLLEIFEKLLDENKTQDILTPFKRKTLLFELFIHTGRTLLYNKGNTQQPLDETSARIQDCAKFIFENYSSNISLKQAADKAGMSIAYFSRKFSEVTGFKFKEYLTNIRIKNSIEMLKNGNLTITQIATACGFSDGNYFGDAFKMQTGFSPREYRKNLNK